MFVCLTLIGLVDKQEKQPLEVFCKKGVLRNLAKFTGKHFCQGLFFNKVAGLKKRLRCSCFPVNFTKFLRIPTATSLKKRLWLRCFRVNFAKFLRTPTFFTEHLRATDSQTTPTTGNSNGTALETDFDCFKVFKFLACYLVFNYIVMTTLLIF